MEGKKSVTEMFSKILTNNNDWTEHVVDCARRIECKEIYIIS